MNFLEALLRDAGKPHIEPHAGEAFFLWTYCLVAREARALLLLMRNHTADPELQSQLQQFISDVLDSQIKRVEGVMREEGIALPETTPDPPKAEAAQIPLGARLQDQQIARMILVKVEGMLDIAYNGMRFCLRTDLAGLFLTFIDQVAAHGYTLRETMLKRGWFPLPPGYGAKPSASH